jgi:hypothetical protein
MISWGLKLKIIPSRSQEYYPNNYMDLSLYRYKNQAISHGKKRRKELARLLW